MKKYAIGLILFIYSTGLLAEEAYKGPQKLFKQVSTKLKQAPKRANWKSQANRFTLKEVKRTRSPASTNEFSGEGLKRWPFVN